MADHEALGGSWGDDKLAVVCEMLRSRVGGAAASFSMSLVSVRWHFWKGIAVLSHCRLEIDLAPSRD